MYAFDASRYRRKREKLVERTYVSHLPTKWGLFQAYCYSSKLDGTEHVAIVKVNKYNFVNLIFKKKFRT
jgi:3,4-dihydroxy 2-butanone 4-phosphate synthase/GTP cyclohydrolase II